MASLVHTLLSNALAASVMAVVVAALSRICRRPALTHSLWLLVLLKLVMPPLVPMPLPVANVLSPIESSLVLPPVENHSDLVAPLETRSYLDADESKQPDYDGISSTTQTTQTRFEPDLIQAAGKPQPTELHGKETLLPSALAAGGRWELAALVVILAGALGWWILATARIIQFQRLLNDVQPASDEWQSHTDQLAEQMRLGWKPSLYLVPGRVPPMLWAIGGRPRLLVPSKLWTGMGADERTSLLLHELAHLKRRDHWVRWLELVVAGLYWWHPVVWWARRSLREAEEQCCDAWVVWAMPKQARTYAGALLAAVEFVSGAPTTPAVASATSGSGHVSCLKRRLQMIVRAKTPKGLSWTGRFAVLAMATLVLPLAPSWAQATKSPSIESDRPTGVDESQRSPEIQPGQHHRQDSGRVVEDRVAQELKKDPALVALTRKIAAVHKQVDSNRGTMHKLIEGLQRQIAKVEAEIDLKRSKLKDLYKKGNIDRTEFELIEATSKLEVKRDAYRQQPDHIGLDRIREEFKRDPDVLALEQQFDETREHLERLKRDPVYHPLAPGIAAQHQLDKLQQEYNDLWNSKYREIRERLTGGVIGDARSRAAIQELEQKVDTLKKGKAKLAELFKGKEAERKASNDDTFQAAFLSHQVQSLQSWEELLKRNLEQLNFEVSQEENHPALSDPALLAARKQLSTLREQHENLRKAKHDQLLALMTKDDGKDEKDDDDKQDKAHDAAVRFQEQLQELVSKLGQELSPVAEEIRKSLEKAVGEINHSLEKEGLSPENLAKALEKSHEDLRKAFEGGGPVDKELREAIEKARKDLQEAFDRARGDVQEQAETFRQRSRELRDRARQEYEHARGEADKGTRRGDDTQLDRDELESARREIRELEQKLRSATRRLDELQRRESRRTPGGRRERNPQPDARPRDRATPRAEPTPAEPPRQPAVPATPTRPVRPNMRRPFPPNRPMPGLGRRGPETENDSRLRELEEKMNRLLKELENLKGEKSSKESRTPSPTNSRPAKETLPIASSRR